MITIPTISELYNDILNELESEFTVNLPLIGPNFLRIMAAVQASKLKLYYLAIANLQKNIFVDTADPESRGGTLERFGRIKLNRDPFPARAGEYVVEVSGDIGAVITGSTTFKSNDDSANPGKLFVLDNDFTLTNILDYITVRALEAGTDSSLSFLDKLTATAPIALVNSEVSVQSATIEPAAAETVEEYRAIIIQNYRLEAQGGAVGDYRLWAADAQGVAAIYPYTAAGDVSTVNVYLEAKTADSIDGKGTPSAGLISDVTDVINLNPDTTLDINERGRLPMSTNLNVIAITPLDVDIDIVGFVGITAAIQAAILDEISSKVSLIRPFISGADVLEEKNDIIDTNKIISMILAVRPGSVFTSIILTVNAVPVSTYTFENGDIPYLNSINYV